MFERVIEIATRAGFNPQSDFSFAKKKTSTIGLVKDFPLTSQIFAGKYRDAERGNAVYVHKPVFERFNRFLETYANTPKLTPTAELVTVGQIWEMLNKMRMVRRLLDKSRHLVCDRLRRLLTDCLAELLPKQKGDSLFEDVRLAKRTAANKHIAEKELELPNYLNPNTKNKEQNERWVALIERCNRFLADNNIS